jgi:multidrug efflux system outer membrane protein
MKKLLICSGLAASMFLTACTVGPKYQRPKVQLPATYRGAAPHTEQQASMADLPWWELFKDPALQELIRTSLQQNYDLRIASERVIAARAQLGITRSQQYPSVEGNAPLTGSKNNPGYRSTFFQLAPDAVFQLDLFGALRKATEASRAQMLATEDTQKNVILTLVGDVAGYYFHLLTLDAQLDVARNTVQMQQESLKLTTLRLQHGTATRVEVLQAQQVLDTANAQIPDIERQITQTENALSMLAGGLPDRVKRGDILSAQYLPPQAPAGLPSELLQRRPDIQAAEQNLIAANANIGVARAAFFPSISLSGGAGGSFGRTNIATSDTPTHFGVWSYAANVTQPIFNAGRLRNNLRVTESQQRQAVLGYQKAIQNGVREVSDSLAGYEKLREVRARQEASVKDLRESLQLSNERYKAGITAYYEVLDAQRSLFAAEQGLAQARGNELQSLVTLYTALGGGWKQ